MYQVFINEHSMFFANKSKINKTNVSTLCISQPVESDFMTIVKWLFNEKVIMKVEFIAENPETLWKSFQAQFVAIAAAGGLIKNAENELLFIKRNGKWDLPKGKVEKGETIAEAAKREVEEECGVTSLEMIKELPSTYHLYEQQDKIMLKETFWFQMKTNFMGTVTPQAEEGITEVAWINPDQMQEQMANTYASLKVLFKN